MIKTLQLVSRFALPPNFLGYCGQGSAPEKFKKCVTSGECRGVEEEVSKFIGLYPYLKTISAITNLPIFSYEVIESYWLGNDQLKKARLEDYPLLLENLEKQGVPEFLIKELHDKIPKVFIPNHLFQVLHVGVGRVSGSVPFNLQSINNCMIRWGKVEKINGQKCTMDLNSLKEEGSGYVLTKIKESVLFDEGFTPNLKIADTVAVHWNFVVRILTEEEEVKLSFWTKEVLKLLF